MAFTCPKCGREEVTYENANESVCRSCGHRVPNAQLVEKPPAI